MTRNEVKEKLIDIINNSALNDEEKREQIVNYYCAYENGFGGKKADRLARQIEKETGFDMSDVRLINEVGAIEK